MFRKKKFFFTDQHFQHHNIFCRIQKDFIYHECWADIKAIPKLKLTFVSDCTPLTFLSNCNNWKGAEKSFKHKNKNYC